MSDAVGFSPADEQFVPHTHAPDRVPMASHVRGTVILSSLRSIRARGLEKPYLAALDPNAVLGLFTWNDDPAYNHREIDVEFSRFGNAADPTNGQFVVQPYATTGNLVRITQPSAVTTSTHAFTWRTSSVDFATSAATPSSWTYAGPDVPQPGGEHARMNLWLFRGQPPSNGLPIEVVITSFTFTPLP